MLKLAGIPVQHLDISPNFHPSPRSCGIYIRMLTLEVLYAVLLGLPVDRLKHLKDTAWKVLCSRIERNLASGDDPLSALKVALADAKDWERTELRKLFTEILPVMSLPRLTYRQKEALIALRYAKSASLTQLCHALMADRSNTRRRMEALVRAGYALQFSQPNGINYMAIAAPLPSKLKHGIKAALDQIRVELGVVAELNPPDLPDLPERPERTD